MAAIHNQPELLLRLREVNQNNGIPLSVKVLFRERVEIGFSYQYTHISDEEAQNLALYLSRTLCSLWTSEDKKINETGLLAEEEVNRQLAAFQGLPRIFDRSRSVVSLFEEWVGSTPAAIAIEHNGVQWSVRGIGGKSPPAGPPLKGPWGGKRKQGGPVYIPEDCDLLTAMLAIFRLEAIYVPIDIDLPGQRVER